MKGIKKVDPLQLTVLAVLLVLQLPVIGRKPYRNTNASLAVAIVVLGYALVTFGVIIASSDYSTPDEALPAWFDISVRMLVVLLVDMIVVEILSAILRAADAGTITYWAYNLMRREPPEQTKTLRVVGTAPMWGPALRQRKGAQCNYTPIVFDKHFVDEDYTILIEGLIDDAMAHRVEAHCYMARLSTKRRVRVQLNTSGGLYHASCRIAGALAALNADKEVIIHVIGDCHSGGTVILCSVPIGQRFSNNHCVFGVHASRSDEPGPSSIADDLLFQVYLDNTYVSEKSLRALMGAGGSFYFFGAEEAIELGFIGSIV